MNWSSAITTFAIGILLIFIAAIIFDDGGMAAATAVCYVGAIIVGLFYKKSET